MDSLLVHLDVCVLREGQTESLGRQRLALGEGRAGAHEQEIGEENGVVPESISFSFRWKLSTAPVIPFDVLRMSAALPMLSIFVLAFALPLSFVVIMTTQPRSALQLPVSRYLSLSPLSRPAVGQNGIFVHRCTKSKNLQAKTVSKQAHSDLEVRTGEGSEGKRGRLEAVVTFFYYPQ